MANVEKDKSANNSLADSQINVIEPSARGVEENTSAAQALIEKKMAELEQKVRIFGNTKIDSFSDYVDWKNLFDQFENVFTEIDNHAHSTKEADYQNIKDRIESLTSELLYYNDGFTRRYNSWTADRGKKLEERADKQQILNFAVFSLFMTLLTFLLSNIVIITKTDFSTKSIIVINLILLLVASVVFLFIGLFFGLVRNKSKKGYVFKHIILCALPFIIAAALVIVSLLM